MAAGAEDERKAFTKANFGRRRRTQQCGVRLTVDPGRRDFAWSAQAVAAVGRVWIER